MKECENISLRQYLAGQVIAGILKGIAHDYFIRKESINRESIVNEAYALADLMIKASDSSK